MASKSFYVTRPRIVPYLFFTWILGSKCQNEGDIRLVGAHQFNGRLEIFHYGIWGTVCGKTFSHMNAYVVCRQLGFRYGTIWLDSIECIGSESSFSDCNHNGWGNHDCDHSLDIAVKCVDAFEGDVRLVGGDTFGRLEIFHNGVWGSICSNHFDYIDAFVACRQLFSDFHHNDIYYTYGSGTGVIWLNNLQGDGTESGLVKCKHNSWGNANCGYENIIALRCMSSSSAPLRLRLVDGGETYGRLEIFYNRTWGTVCDDGFGINEATVVCRQFDLSPMYGAAHYIDGNGTGTIWLDDLQCLGEEKSVQDCNYRGWGKHNCGHHKDVGVRCQNTSDIPTYKEEVAIRLVDGGETYGRLEVFYNGSWGTVCDDSFGNNDAAVVCRKFHLFPNATNGLAYYTHGNGNGTIWLDDVQCQGKERHLRDCAHRGWGKHNCKHYEDVGVRCLNLTDMSMHKQGDLRLEDGISPYSGRLEVYYDNKWRSVCGPKFGILEAQTACQQIGYGTENVVVYSRDNSNEAQGIFMDELRCTFVEERLDMCFYKGWLNRTCSQVVGIRCHNEHKIGHWASWSTYAKDPFFNGYQTRNRRCYSYETVKENHICLGSPFEIKRCRSGYCEAQWSSWSAWRECNEECFEGNQMRLRWCNNPSPQTTYSNYYCPGSSYELRNCTNTRCYVLMGRIPDA